jgi:hypothetical protein
MRKLMYNNECYIAVKQKQYQSGTRNKSCTLKIKTEGINELLNIIGELAYELCPTTDSQFEQIDNLLKDL